MWHAATVGLTRTQEWPNRFVSHAAAAWYSSTDPGRESMTEHCLRALRPITSIIPPWSGICTCRGRRKPSPGSTTAKLCRQRVDNNGLVNQSRRPMPVGRCDGEASRIPTHCGTECNAPSLHCLPATAPHATHPGSARPFCAAGCVLWVPPAPAGGSRFLLAPGVPGKMQHRPPAAAPRRGPCCC